MGPAEPYWMSSLICKLTIYSQVAASPADSAAVLLKALCIQWWFKLTGPRRSHLWSPPSRWKEEFQLCYQMDGSKGDYCLTPGFPCRSPPSRNGTGISEWRALTPNCTSVGRLWKVEPGVWREPAACSKSWHLCDFLQESADWQQTVILSPIFLVFTQRCWNELLGTMVLRLWCMLGRLITTYRWSISPGLSEAGDPRPRSLY